MATSQIHGRDWDAIRRQYEAGGVGQRRLARLLGIPESTLMKRAMNEKWRQNSQIVKKAIGDLEAEVESRVEKRVKEELAPWIEEEKVKFTKRGVKVANRGMNRIEKLFKSVPNAKDESYISKAAESYHRIGRTALGMNDDHAPGGAFTISVLANHAAVQFNAPDPA